ncbi:hypothetical protein DN402_18860 [Streptomyces sp. SW4]|nr:hypothetical protein DN402_18860 [Streptomyces sp. SW4]
MTAHDYDNQLLESVAVRRRRLRGLVTQLTSLRAARADLTVPARLEAPPVPVAFTRAGHHHRLGDGTDPGAWERLAELLRKPAPEGR